MLAIAFAAAWLLDNAESEAFGEAVPDVVVAAETGAAAAALLTSDWRSPVATEDMMLPTSSVAVDRSIMSATLPTTALRFAPVPMRGARALRMLLTVPSQPVAADVAAAAGVTEPDAAAWDEAAEKADGEVAALLFTAGAGMAELSEPAGEGAMAEDEVWADPADCEAVVTLAVDD